VVRRHAGAFRPDQEAIAEKLSSLDADESDTMQAMQQAFSDPALLLQVTNSSGNTVIEKNITAGRDKHQLQIDVSKLYPGIYYVSLTSGKNVVSRQFIKK